MDKELMKRKEELFQKIKASLIKKIEETKDVKEIQNVIKEIHNDFKNSENTLKTIIQAQNWENLGELCLFEKIKKSTIACMEESGNWEEMNITWKTYRAIFNNKDELLQSDDEEKFLEDLLDKTLKDYN